MRNDIQPNLQTIGEYFTRKEFYIPSYQRPYAWQVAQCEQLIEDINIHNWIIALQLIKMTSAYSSRYLYNAKNDYGYNMWLEEARINWFVRGL